VKKDITKARQVGVQGVPFFVLNNKYAVSGAQSSPIFLDALQKAYSEFKKEKNPDVLNVTEGASCSTDGNC
jgi:predicted DsbA family dithiol-disulfide isomerase